MNHNRNNIPVTLDIVIPIYNEENVINLVFKRLSSTFSESTLREHQIKNMRCIFVDDGSTDQSAELVCRHIGRGFPAVLYRLSRNFGHQNALRAGLDAARADLVAVMDADLQDPPELILKMVGRWREDYDVVYGVRRRRKESPIRVFLTWVFYRIINFLSDLPIANDSGDFCLMDKKVVEAIAALPEKLPYPRVLRAWIGFRQTGMEYERPARAAGYSKYPLSALYKLATDGIASATVRPIKLAQFYSFFFLILTACSAFLTFHLLDPQISTGLRIGFLLNYALVILSSLVQIFCLYILSAYIGRLYLEVKGRPSYVIMETVANEILEPRQDSESQPKVASSHA